MKQSPVAVQTQAGVRTVILERPQCRNAVNRPTADALAQAFLDFEADPEARVAVLHGAGGHFCAGADLAALASGEQANRTEAPSGAALDASGPMGPTRLQLSKPVIAAVSGYAVAGGLELALWCDLRVVERSAVFGVFCRRWGVPLIDGGTIRLARTIGQGRALDMILTGRAVGAEEALAIGLADRLVEDGDSLAEACELARQIAEFPQACLRADRASCLEQFGAASLGEALRAEFERGSAVLGEAVRGAARFRDGAGRHGSFD